MLTVSRGMHGSISVYKPDEDFICEIDCRLSAHIKLLVPNM